MKLITGLLLLNRADYCDQIYICIDINKIYLEIVDCHFPLTDGGYAEAKFYLCCLVFLVHLFGCFARVRFCPFSLPLGCEGWLRFVIVAYPGPFY